MISPVISGAAARAARGLGRGPRRLARMSLRARLLLITTALLVAGLVVSNTIVIGYLRGYLVARVDGQLRPLAMIVSRLPDQVVSRTAPPLAAKTSTVRMDLIKDLYIAVLGPDGRTRQVLHLPGNGAPGPALPPLGTAAVTARGGRAFTVPSTHGSTRWRVIAFPHTVTGQGPSGSLVMAASLDEVNATIDRLRVTCLIVGAAVSVLLALAGWFAVRAGLRPLREVERTAAAIAGGDLSRRVPDLAAPRTEVARLSAALNGMLARIEAGVSAQADSEARMRRFVRDASHELRTPLFGIKGFAELYRMGGLAGPGDVDRTMRRIEGESGRLARLVEDLLLLARLDEGAGAGEFPMILAPMDLRTLAADALHDLGALDPDRPVRLSGPDGGPPGAAPVLGDEARLRQVVSNLVGNLIAHTSPGTPVRIGVGVTGADAFLEVEDAGPGLTGEQAARVFERFYRADGSRSRTGGGGAGLGLAIVASLVAAHGGRVDLRTSPGAGATFRVVLPVAPDNVT